MITKNGSPFTGATLVIGDASAEAPCDHVPGLVDGLVESDGTLGGRRLDSSGRFLLAPGTYYFVVRHKMSDEHPWHKVGPSWGSIWFYESGDCEDAQLVTVEPGETFTLRWDVTRGTSASPSVSRGVVSGVVRDAQTGIGLARAVIRAFSTQYCGQTGGSVPDAGG